jgi:hypothetical protein
MPEKGFKTTQLDPQRSPRRPKMTPQDPKDYTKSRQGKTRQEKRREEKRKRRQRQGQRESQDKDKHRPRHNKAKARQRQDKDDKEKATQIFLLHILMAYLYCIS